MGGKSSNANLSKKRATDESDEIYDTRLTKLDKSSTDLTDFFDNLSDFPTQKTLALALALGTIPKGKPMPKLKPKSLKDVQNLYFGCLPM